MDNFCIFSEDRKYRYVLEHVWDDNLPKICWIGLNPSTADEQKLDPTLRRVKGFSIKFGYGSFVMLNLFAFRATLPKDMMKQGAAAAGNDNDKHILDQISRTDKVVAMWSKDGKFLRRQEELVKLLDISKLYYLKLNKDGSPSHCLYLPESLELQKWIA